MQPLRPMRKLWQANQRRRARKVLRNLGRPWPNDYDSKVLYAEIWTESFRKGREAVQKDMDNEFYEWYGQALLAEPIPVS